MPSCASPAPQATCAELKVNCTHTMGSIEDNYPLPLVSYLDLVHDDKKTRDSSRAELVQSLGRYGACRISDHGIPQSVIDKCFEKVGVLPVSSFLLPMVEMTKFWTVPRLL